MLWFLRGTKIELMCILCCQRAEKQNVYSPSYVYSYKLQTRFWEYYNYIDSQHLTIIYFPQMSTEFIILQGNCEFSFSILLSLFIQQLGISGSLWDLASETVVFYFSNWVTSLVPMSCFSSLPPSRRICLYDERWMINL